MSPRFKAKNADGDEVVIETAVPREMAALRNQGFTEEKARTTEVKQQDQAAAKASEAKK